MVNPGGPTRVRHDYAVAVARYFRTAPRRERLLAELTYMLHDLAKEFAVPGPDRADWVADVLRDTQAHVAEIVARHAGVNWRLDELATEDVTSG